LYFADNGLKLTFFTSEAPKRATARRKKQKKVNHRFGPPRGNARTTGSVGHPDVKIGFCTFELVARNCCFKAKHSLETASILSHQEFNS
jgi:hypothetical protein